MEQPPMQTPSYGRDSYRITSLEITSYATASYGKSCGMIRQKGTKPQGPRNGVFTIFFSFRNVAKL